MRWIPFAAASAIFLASADFFVKLASSRISSSLGALIYGLTTMAAALVWVLYERATGQPQFSTPQGLAYSFLVGLAFSGVTFLLFVTYSKVDVSIGSPAIRLSAIILAGVLGIVVLREPFTWRYFLGTVLAIASVWLIVFR
jgi:drug/metabolite transporter (DMT)-like permease